MMSAETAQLLPTSDTEIALMRDFNAPVELVWKAMTDPKHVVKWWGPTGFTNTLEVHDFRVGGIWKHTMHGPDGTNYPNKSVFKEIVPFERVVYSHGGGDEDGDGASFLATWTFERLDAERTRLTMRLTFRTAEMRNHVIKEYGAIEGGQQTLSRLAEYLPGMTK